MQAFGGGGFLGLGSTLRSLTASPIQTAVNEAHRMARRRLEAGGAAAAPSPKRVEPDTAPAEFVLPADIDAKEVRKAIEAQLGDRGSVRGDPTGAPPVLERRAGGRIAGY